ncbi:MAG: hypothetical protein QXJ02_05085 [Candidatus Bathyarchaeia archaeon]
MKGKIILLVFFMMFTVASLLIPSPLFPGNFLCFMLGLSVSSFYGFLSAVINGVVYGLILWTVFVVLSKRFEE